MGNTRHDEIYKSRRPDVVECNFSGAAVCLATLEGFGDLFDWLAMFWSMGGQRVDQKPRFNLRNYRTRLDIGIIIANAVDSCMSCFSKPEKWIQ